MARMKKFEFNGPQFREAMIRAFIEAQPLLVRRFTQEVEAEKWTWPNPPSPRDIVDTGRLRDSLNNPQHTGPRTPTVEKTGHLIRAVHTWHVPYAAYVHEGYTLRSGFFGPPRPWTKPAIEGFNWREHMIKVVHQQLVRLAK